MSKIFVSYSRKNTDKINEMNELIRDLGYEVWYDGDASGGEKWWNAIVTSIQKCDIFVFALSPESIDSPACNLEYKYATDLKKPILPIMLADARLPVGTLDEIQYVDARHLDKNTTITYLSKSLRDLERRIQAGEFPPLAEMPEIPPVPRNIDPLADVRKIVMNIENAKSNDLITAIFELKRIVRENSRLIKDAEELLGKITDHPYVPQIVAKEARETLEYFSAGSKITTSPTLSQQAGRRSGLVTISVIIVAIVVIMLLAFNLRSVSIQADSALTATFSAIAMAQNTANAEITNTASQTATVASTDTLSPEPTQSPSVAPTNTLEPTQTVTSTTTSSPEPTETPTNTPEPTQTALPTVVSINRDNLQQLIELESSPLIGHLSSSDINTLAFSPDGMLLASAGSDRFVNVWQVSDWSIVKSFEFETEVKAVNFSPDNQQLAIGLWNGTDGVVLIDLSTDQRTVIGSHDFQVNEVKFNPTGNLLASSSSDGNVKLWDVITGELKNTLNHSSDWGAWRLSFSPDGKYLASSGSDGTVKLWDTSNGRLMGEVQIVDAALIENIGDSYIYAMTFAPDGRHVYIGNGGEKSDGRLRVWNIAEGTVQTANTVIDRFYSNLVLMPGDDFIISVSFERLILFWDQDLTLLHRISLDEAPFNVTGQGRIIEGLAVHPSGTIIAIGSRDGRVRLIGLP